MEGVARRAENIAATMKPRVTMTAGIPGLMIMAVGSGSNVKTAMMAENGSG